MSEFITDIPLNTVNWYIISKSLEDMKYYLSLLNRVLWMNLSEEPMPELLHYQTSVETWNSASSFAQVIPSYWQEC